MNRAELSTRKEEVSILEPIRILQVLGGTSLGGAESRIMDLYRCIDKEKVQFDFMVHTKESGYYDKEIIELGGHIYRVPSFRFYNWFSYREAWKIFLEKHQEFQVIHGHMTSTAIIYLPVAKKAGVPMTIAHGRSAGVDKGPKGWLTKLMRLTLRYKTDMCVACSKEAGLAVFGKKWMTTNQVKIIPNAIDIQQYDYNPMIREKIRKELHLENNYVLGHVGSFRYAKNHEYLIEIFCEYLKLNQKGKLLLLGEGSLLEGTKALVAKNKIEDHVLFMGNKSDTNSYYQAMDIFIFPSRYEGLPGTVVEAQTTGLTCFISNTITEDVMVTDLVKTLDITISPKEWAEVVHLDRTDFRQNYQRQGKIKEMQKAGFDVREQVKEYEKIYLNIINNKE